MSRNSAPPMYMQVIAYLTDRIRSGEYKPGDRLPTEYQLMKQFSVSRIVVANALTRMAVEGTVYRVPGRGTFVTDDLQKQKRPVPSDGRRKIALVAPWVHDPFSSSLVEQTVKSAFGKNVDCPVYFSQGIQENEEQCVLSAVQSGAEGILLFPSHHDIYNDIYNRVILRLMDEQFPIVLMDRMLFGLNLPCAQTDNLEAGRLAAKCLLNHGHKRISFLSHTGNETPPIARRIDGMIDELTRHINPVDHSLIVTNFWDSQRALPVLTRIVRNRSATAFIVSGGDIYKLLYKTIMQNGFSVPEDFSVVNIDPVNTSELPVAMPTYVRQNTEKIADDAITMLLSIIEGTFENSEHQRFSLPSLVDNGTVRNIL